MVMTVNRLGDDRVLVVLGDEEMRDFRLDFERMSLSDSHARRVLTRLTQMACRRSGISTDGRRMNIEALSLGEGCYLLITVGKGRHWRLSGSSACVCAFFKNSSDLLDAAEALARSGAVCRRNSAYAFKNGYCLLFSYPALPFAVTRLLSEYGSLSRDPLRCAAVAEHGRLLCARNAVETIGRAMTH